MKIKKVTLIIHFCWWWGLFSASKWKNPIGVLLEQGWYYWCIHDTCYEK